MSNSANTALINLPYLKKSYATVVKILSPLIHNSSLLRVILHTKKGKQSQTKKTQYTICIRIVIVEATLTIIVILLVVKIEMPHYTLSSGMSRDQQRM